MATDIYLTKDQLDALFQGLTTSILGYTGTDADSLVRISWPPQGQPTWGLTDDVCFIQVVPQRGAEYSLQRYEKFSSITPDTGQVERNVAYTRVLEVFWTFYGPNSLDHADLIRDSIFYQENHDVLAQSNVYLVTDVEQPTRAPEAFAGQWWERVDLPVRFNELVNRNSQVPWIADQPVTVESASNTVTEDITPAEEILWPDGEPMTWPNGDGVDWPS